MTTDAEIKAPTHGMPAWAVAFGLRHLDLIDPKFRQAMLDRGVLLGLVPNPGNLIEPGPELAQSTSGDCLA
jgi:hypothetical protein